MPLDTQALLTATNPDAGLPLTPANSAPLPTAQIAAPAAPTVVQAPNWASSFLAPSAPAQTTGQSDSSAPQPPPAPGSFAAKLKASADQLGIPAGPGGWARSLVGSAVSALGDASAAAGYSGGAPGLVGIERTMQARSQRLAQEKQQQFEQQKQILQQQRENQAALDQHDKNKIDMGVANAQMIHQMALVHQLGQEEIDKSIKDGVKFTQDALDAPAPARVIAKDVTADELHDMLNKGTLDPHTQSPQPTGKKQIGTDANGVPQYATTYTLLSDFPPHKPTEEEAEEASRLTGSTISPGTEIPGVQWNSLQQQVSNAKVTQAAMQKAKDLADIEISDRQSKLAGIQLGQIPEFTNALANNNGNPIAAERAIIANPALRSKFPNLHSDIVAYFGGEKEYEAATKAQEDQIREQQKQDETVRHDKAQERIEAERNYNEAHPLGGALNNIPQSDGLKAQIEQLRSVNPSAAAIVDRVPPVSQASLMAVAFGDGSTDFKSAFSPRPPKGSGQLSSSEALGIIKQLNPNWDEHQYARLQAAYKDATDGPNGAAIQQYNNFMQHSANLANVMNDTYRVGPKVWNTALNKLENEGYGTTATQIQAAIAPVKGEFTQLMAGNYKPSQEDQALYDQILNPSATPGQISQALKTLADTGAIRLDNINENYKRSARKNLPGLVAPRTLDAAKTIGASQTATATLNGLNSGGTIFGDQSIIGSNTPVEQPGRPQPQATPAGQVRVQIPGMPPGVIPQSALQQFKQAHPNAQVIQ